MEKQDETPRSPPTGWLDALERGEADLAAGRTVPVTAVLDELKASLERMDAKRGPKVPNAA